MNRVTREATSTHPDVSMQEVVSVKCPKAQKEYFTVIKNVRKGHQIQDDGEFQVRSLKKLLKSLLAIFFIKFNKSRNEFMMSFILPK